MAPSHETAGWVADDGSWIRRQVFSDQALYERERRTVFLRSWLVVAHESQVPEPGDFVSSWMGEDPVIVSRSMDGTVRVLLNACPHRGVRVCREQLGSATGWTCPNHGWTFDLAGRRCSTSGGDAGYPSSGGDDDARLQEARVGSYCGFVFATFDRSAPSLDDYLGDARFYLDTVFDRYDGGVEVVGPPQRARVSCNWKALIENLGTDLHHVFVVHRSFVELWPHPVLEFMEESEQVALDGGHAVCLAPGIPEYADPTLAGDQPDDPVVVWLTAGVDETRRRLGDARAGLFVYQGSVFPSFAFHPALAAVYLCHPRGPTEVEWWAWCVVPRDAPQEYKRARHDLFTQVSGPAGLVLSDDTENWIETTTAATSRVAEDVPYRVDRAMGQHHTVAGLPGTFAALRSEHAARAFWRHWQSVIADDQPGAGAQ